LSDTREFLEKIMSRYVEDNAKDKDFKQYLHDQYLYMNDGVYEGYSEEEMVVQREFSINFTFGHNHDFGSFYLKGAMGDRHLQVVERFIDVLGLPMDLTDKHLLDVGIWCGGTTLLFAGMGAKIYAFEEVRKYAGCAQYLAYIFDDLIPNRPNILHKSIYDCNYENKFNIVACSGVLYHLTDIILALRIMFNSLKDGGELYIETAFTDEISSGALQYARTKGSNWFIPGHQALHAMVSDVGFEIVNGFPWKKDRYLLKAVREEWKPMMKAGLSRRVR